MERKRIADWASKIGISTKVLRRAVHKGHLRAVQIGAATSPFLCSQSDIDAWLDSRTVRRRAW